MNKRWSKCLEGYERHNCDLFRWICSVAPGTDCQRYRPVSPCMNPFGAKALSYLAVLATCVSPVRHSDIASNSNHTRRVVYIVPLLSTAVRPPRSLLRDDYDLFYVWSSSQVYAITKCPWADYERNMSSRVQLGELCPIQLSCSDT